MGAKEFSIPAWSPDLNPTENVFNYVGTRLHEEFLNRNITFQNYEKSFARVKKNFIISTSLIYKLNN